MHARNHHAEHRPVRIPLQPNPLHRTTDQSLVDSKPAPDSDAFHHTLDPGNQANNPGPQLPPYYDDQLDNHHATRLHRLSRLLPIHHRKPHIPPPRLPAKAPLNSPPGPHNPQHAPLERPPLTQSARMVFGRGGDKRPRAQTPHAASRYQTAQHLPPRR